MTVNDYALGFLRRRQKCIQCDPILHPIGKNG